VSSIIADLKVEINSQRILSILYTLLNSNQTSSVNISTDQSNSSSTNRIISKNVQNLKIKPEIPDKNIDVNYEINEQFKNVKQQKDLKKSAKLDENTFTNQEILPKAFLSTSTKIQTSTKLKKVSTEFTSIIYPVSTTPFSTSQITKGNKIK
jgi:hypothetical protein